MDKYFEEFMNMYHSNMIENKNSMNAIQGRLVKNYKENNNTPIVRAFKVYYQLKQQIENINPVEEVRKEEVKEEVKEEEQQIAYDENGPIGVWVGDPDDDNSYIQTFSSDEEEQQNANDDGPINFDPDENGDEPQLSDYRKPIDVSVSKKELAQFTKKDFMETEEYKWCIENDKLPSYTKECIDDETKEHYWQGVHYNLKLYVERLKQ